MTSRHHQCSNLIFDKAHRGGRSHVSGHGLNPFVTHLTIRYIVGVLSTNLSIIVDFVAQGPGIVAFVDGTLSGEVKLVMACFLRRVISERLGPVSVVEMSVLKESDALRAEISGSLRLDGLKSTLVLCLARETSIAGLEMRARDVGLGELVQASIDAPGCAEGILEGDLGVDGPVEIVIARDFDAIRCHFSLVLLALVIWGIN